jgi:uncharacterized membrane protein YkoI
MSKKLKISCLCITLIVGISVGVVIQASNSTGAKTVAKSTTPVHWQVKPKINREQAVNIALNAHKGAKILSITLNKNIYVIHIKATLGKRTLQVGAYTGKILSDKLDWVKKITK